MQLGNNFQTKYLSPRHASLSLLMVVFSALILSSCAPKEETTPLYEPEEYKFETVTLNIESAVNDIPAIEPQGLRRFIYKIPWLGDLLSIPLDLTAALLPPIPFNEYLDIGEGDIDLWADPDFLKLVKGIRLKSGYLQEKTKQEILDEGHKPGKKSWLCKKNEGIEFIKSMTLVLEYTDHRYPQAPVYKVPLAYTDSKQYFDKEHRRYDFKIYDQNVRPFVEYFNDFKLKLKAKGGFPCIRTYLKAGFVIELKLDIKKDEHAK